MSSTRYFMHLPADENTVSAPTSTLSSANFEKAALLFVAISKDEQDWSSEPHSHYFSEIFLITNGSGKFHVGNSEFTVSPNDFVILNPYAEHTEMSMENSSLEYIVLGMDGVSLLDSKEFAVLRNRSYAKDLTFYLMTLAKEMQKKDFHHNLLCQSLLNIVLITICRNEDTFISIAPSAKASRECILIKKYIDNHFQECITLDSLSQLVHWNKFYLTHSFTSAYGVAPIHYLMEKRIEESKYMLRNTTYSLSTIASLTGFSSPSYFSQAFKKVVRLTPLAYRKANSNPLGN